ncbi:cell division protein ZapD [Vibrio sp.]|nr:cell division protein ZapD [Vibrio sp.]
MTVHMIEHPLNEKARIYLRVEVLLQQLRSSSQFSDAHHYLTFFRSLFDLVEIFEQIQIKVELGKDLEKTRIAYRNWQDVEGVDQDALSQLLHEVNTIYSQLMASPRFGQALKEDRFLSSIRQRFSLPGGACSFDLPALHHWLHLPLEERKKYANNWIGTLAVLESALNLWLKLVRESNTFSQQKATSGTYQSDANEAVLLRLNVDSTYRAYPMISGHKNRFVIKFIDFETGQAFEEDVAFSLSVCN